MKDRLHGSLLFVIKPAAAAYISLCLISYGYDEESLSFYRFGILWLIDTFLQQIDSLWQQRPAAIKYTILDICAQQAAGAASLRIFRSDT